MFNDGDRDMEEAYEAYRERMDGDEPSSASEMFQEQVRWDGAYVPNQAWILADCDVWYPNPHYRGPKVMHPEEYEHAYAEYEESIGDMPAEITPTFETWIAARNAANEILAARAKSEALVAALAASDDEIPF